MPASNRTQILDPAFFVCRWKGGEVPTLIYHHGNNERIFDFGPFSKNSFQTIFGKKNQLPDCNIILVRAPFHNHTLAQYRKHVSYLSHFMSMLCTAVLLTESLLAFIKRNSKHTVCLCGISLGGWVTNLHYTYFGNADTYIPLLAGADLADVFLHSAYRKMTGENAQKNREAVENFLNFEQDFKKVGSPNIFGLLAQYDQSIRLEKQ